MIRNESHGKQSTSYVPNIDCTRRALVDVLSMPLESHSDGRSIIQG